MKASFFLASAIFVCSSSFLNGMDESVKQKIEKLRKNHVVMQSNHLKYCEECQYNSGTMNCSLMYHTSLTQQINKTIMEAGNLVSSQEKLNNLWGDYMYSTRKNIIKNMIQEGINPNNIKYHIDETPLREATIFNDIEFGEFLIQHGAEPDKKTIKIATPEFLIAMKK